MKRQQWIEIEPHSRERRRMAAGLLEFGADTLKAQGTRLGAEKGTNESQETCREIVIEIAFGRRSGLQFLGRHSPGKVRTWWKTKKIGAKFAD
jgi:hypothetical protein